MSRQIANKKLWTRTSSIPHVVARSDLAGLLRSTVHKSCARRMDCVRKRAS